MAWWHMGNRPHRHVLDRLVPTLVALTAFTEQLPGLEIIGGLSYFAANSERLRNRIQQQPEQQLPAGLHYRKGVGVLTAVTGYFRLPDGTIPALSPEVVTALGHHPSAVALGVAAATGSVIQLVQGRRARLAANPAPATRRGRRHNARRGQPPPASRTQPSDQRRIRVVKPNGGNGNDSPGPPR